jgi:hypothetical protein
LAEEILNGFELSLKTTRSFDANNPPDQISKRDNNLARATAPKAAAVVAAMPEVAMVVVASAVADSVAEAVAANAVDEAAVDAVDLVAVVAAAVAVRAKVAADFAETITTTAARLMATLHLVSTNLA